MKIIINFIKGFKATGRSTQMVLLVFVINLTFSLILTVPMYHSLKNSFGYSEVGERMVKGFDYLWWEEFSDKSEGLETTFTPSLIGKGAVLNNLEALVQMRFFNLPPAVLTLVIIYIILHTFLAGGILFTFVKKDSKFSLKGFFEGAAANFFRFFLIMIISWMFFLLISVFLGGGFSSILRDIRQNAVSEITPFYVGLGFSAVFFFFLLFIQMVFDYARIKTVFDESRNVIKSVLGAYGFVFKHLGSSLGLYYLIFIVSSGFTVIYTLIIEFLPQSFWLGVLATFLIQQLFIFGLIWIRCWLYSSQMELYRYLK